MVKLVFLHTHFRDVDPRGERFWITCRYITIAYSTRLCVCMFICMSVYLSVLYKFVFSAHTFQRCGSKR